MRVHAHRVISHLTYANVMSTIAVLLVVGGGTAYAANTVFSADIVNGEVKTADIGLDQVTSSRIAPGAVFGSDLQADSVTSAKVLIDSLTSADLAADSVTASEVLDGSLAGADIANSSLTGDDVASSSLTGIDIASGSLTSSDILDESLDGTEIADGGLTTSDLALSSITGSRIADSAVTTSDIANRTVNMDDINGADRSGSIDVGAISNGRCVTITGSVSGAQAGDVALLTTNGALAGGMMVYAQRALTNEVHIKVCNLSGATSAPITDLPVRVITIH
jgi:hypothetical protein